MALSKKKRMRKRLIILTAVLLAAAIFLGSLNIAAAVRGQSALSLAVDGALALFYHPRSEISEATAAKKLARAQKRNSDYTVSSFILDAYDLQTYTIDGFEVCLFNAESSSESIIFYLHGGAFVEQPLIFHYEFLKKITNELDCAAVMPIYPKAPEYTFVDALDIAVKAYSGVLENTLPENITVMGDSAGAAMSLSLCMYLNEIGLPQPNNVIMLSPCLDASLENPEIPDYQKIDRMLSSAMLKHRFLSYAGGAENILDYRVSPMFGDISSLAPMTVIMGTNEIFIPDARLFKAKAEEAGIAINYYEFAHMPHAFPLYPMPEGKQARELIKQIAA